MTINTGSSLREIVGWRILQIVARHRLTIKETRELLEQCDCAVPACIAARLRLARA